MDSSLDEALDIVAREWPHFDKSFDAVERALRDIGEDRLAEKLVRLAPEAPWQAIAGFLAIASWDVSPAAESEIFRQAEQWLLQCDDLRLAQVALHLDVIPFSRASDPADRCEAVLTKVAETFPQLREQCFSLLRQRTRPCE